MLIIRFVLVFLFLTSNVYASCFTCYLVLPKKAVNKLNVTIDRTDSNIVISTGKTDPTKYYEVISIDKAAADLGWEVGDRFTGKSRTLTAERTVREVSNVWPIKHNNFSARVVGTTATGKKVVYALFKRHFLKSVRNLVESDDIENETALNLSKLKSLYIGKTRASVFAKFPELIGNLEKTKWSCEIE